MAPWSFVCPASRGIGLQLTRHILRTTSLPVVATARSKPQELKKSILDEMKDIEEKRLTVLELDVTGIFLSLYFLLAKLEVMSRG